jgi:hypothetical protein
VIPQHPYFVGCIGASQQWLAKREVCSALARDERLAACWALDPGEVDSLDLGGLDATPALRADRVERGANFLQVDRRLCAAFNP